MSTQAVTIHGVITPPKTAADHWHIAGDIVFDPNLPVSDTSLQPQNLCVSGYVIATPTAQEISGGNNAD